MLDVSEIFGPTVQGEGKRVGRPSIFIRLARCNFSCSGLGVEYLDTNGTKKFGCDTFYAVDPCFKKQWKKQSAQHIISEVNSLCGEHKYDIVISGGEPLLFWKNKDFQSLIKHYIDQNHLITIETNASLPIQFTHEYQKRILFSMSVKLAYVNESAKKRINISALKHIIESSDASYFKFVINHQIEDCIDEIKEITTQLPLIDIYLMPQGDTVEAISKNDKAVIQLCTEQNYIYCDRTHVRVWNDQRGV